MEFVCVIITFIGHIVGRIYMDIVINRCVFMCNIKASERNDYKKRWYLNDHQIIHF